MVEIHKKSLFQVSPVGWFQGPALRSLLGSSGKWRGAWEVDLETPGAIDLATVATVGFPALTKLLQGKYVFEGLMNFEMLKIKTSKLLGYVGMMTMTYGMFRQVIIWSETAPTEVWDAEFWPKM